MPTAVGLLISLASSSVSYHPTIKNDLLGLSRTISIAASYLGEGLIVCHTGSQDVEASDSSGQHAAKTCSGSKLTSILLAGTECSPTRVLLAVSVVFQGIS